MSQKQLNRHAVISKVIDGHLTVAEAAIHLRVSTRQILRIKKGLIQEGPSSIIHKNTNRKPAHALSAAVADQILAFRQKEPFQASNFQHFQELLAEHADIRISYSALHCLLTKHGFVSPKKRRRFKPHRRRKRKPQEGLLLQLDATPFAWFGTDEKCALHGAIDDATSKVVGLYLTKNECLHGYWETVRQVLVTHGIPSAIYADRHTIFLSQNAGKLSLEDQLSGKVVNDTQFGRAMSELGISLLAARSPQAKGRIERLWETLQSRLPVEFKLAGISSIDQANAFLLQYIKSFNLRFAVDPAETISAYRILPPALDVDSILCVKLFRSIDNGGVFSFGNRRFMVANESAAAIPPKAKILVLVSPSFGIKVQFRNIIYSVLPYICEKKAHPKKGPASQNKPAPPDNHPWKFGQSLAPKLSFEEDNQAILSMLESIFLSQYA